MMKKLILSVFLLAVGVGAGFGLSQLKPGLTSQEAAQKGEKKILYWVAPMDPNYRRDEPGKSPMGMDLIPVYEGQVDGKDDDEPGIRIDANVVNNIGVRTASVERTTLHRMINTVGFLMPDDNFTRDIHVRTDGWIEKLAVRTVGDRVKKGDLLFQIYSRDLSNAQAEFVQALTIGQKTLANAARARLAALGMPDRQIAELAKSREVRELVDVYAPQDGFAITLNVREGMYVKPNTTVLTLADFSSIWVMVEVYEDHVSQIAEGQKAEMRLPFIPGKIWEGTVDYVYPTINAKSRTAQVRLKFQNPEWKLKPNMYAEITIYGSSRENVLAVPRAALIQTGKSERVILALGDGKFRPAQVVSGTESGDLVEIIVGLKEGETIVTSGQFLLDSEASIDASLLRMVDQSDGGTNGRSEDKQISGLGVIRELKPDERKINVTHEPIEALGWPDMTMDFRVAEQVDFAALKPGDEIRFELRRDAEQRDYLITSVAAKGDAEAASSSAIFASGVVKAVNAGEQTIKVKHEPIAALSWPSMTTDFPVDATVDLSALKAGQEIKFKLERAPDNAGYVITSIGGMRAGAPDTASDIKASGVVKMVKSGEQKLNITHEPIAALGWPSMTMDFRVAKGISLASLKSGDKIQFDLARDKKAGGYVVTSISKARK